MKTFLNGCVTWVVGSLMALVFLAACSSGKPPAVQSVEALVQALVAKDEASYLAHTCPDFEDVALLEYDSFSLVETRLEGLSCQVVEEQGDQAKVVCQGHIIASYGAEDQTIELSERTYQVVNHSGEWLVCGY